MLYPILHPSSGVWMLGKVEDHTAKPLSREEIEQHIAEFNLLRGREKSMMKLAEHIEAATVDKARLDWLQKRNSPLQTYLMEASPDYTMWTAGGDGAHRDPRSAIDAAMKLNP